MRMSRPFEVWGAAADVADGRVVDRDVDDLRFGREDLDVVVFDDDGLLGGVGKRADGAGLGAEALDGFFEVGGLVGVGEAELAGPGEVVGEEVEDGRVVGEGLDRGVPELGGDLVVGGGGVGVEPLGGDSEVEGEGGSGQDDGEEGVGVESDGGGELVELGGGEWAVANGGSGVGVQGGEGEGEQGCCRNEVGGTGHVGLLVGMLDMGRADGVSGIVAGSWVGREDF